MLFLYIFGNVTVTAIYRINVIIQNQKTVPVEWIYNCVSLILLEIILRMCFVISFIKFCIFMYVILIVICSSCLKLSWIGLYYLTCICSLCLKLSWIGLYYLSCIWQNFLWNFGSQCSSTSYFIWYFQDFLIQASLRSLFDTKRTSSVNIKFESWYLWWVYLQLSLE